MAKHLIMIHGRHFKPSKEDLERNWMAAIRAGISRDYGEAQAEALGQLNTQMAYYGDVSNRFLSSKGKSYDQAADQDDRQHTLASLQQYARQDFVEERGNGIYHALPHQTAVREALADTLGEALAFFHVGKPLVSVIAPDMAEYWNPETQFSSDARQPLSRILSGILNEDDSDVLLIAHSLGSLIAYDTLWKFSYMSEYEHIRDKKINTFLTIGSPLGDSLSKRNLKGSHIQGHRRYPANISRWINIAAEDDYVAHDQTVADDFSDMTEWGLVDSPIVDQRIYNLAVRNGRSNPHHGAGYLIHPVVSTVIVDWMNR